MKEHWKNALRKLHGKHYNGRSAARRLGAFAVAAALVTTLVAAQVPGIAYALTGDDLFDTGYEELFDVGNYYYDTYGLDAYDSDDQENPAVEEEEPQTDVPEEDADEDAVTLPELDEEQPVDDGTESMEPEEEMPESGTTVIYAPDPYEEMLDDLDPDMGEHPSTVDFTDYITDVSLKWQDPKTDASNAWHEMQDLPDGKLNYGDNLQFTLEYDLEEGALWYEKTDGTEGSYEGIHYELPEALKSVTENGTVYDASGNPVGSYAIEDGGVVIKFAQNYIDGNQGGAITGKLSFSCSVSELQGGTDGTVAIKFNEKVQCEVAVKSKPIDLKLTKDAVGSVKDVANNIIQYTVTISTEEGTNGNTVTLNDELSIVKRKATVEIGAQYKADKIDLKVTKKDGEDVTEKCKLEIQGDPDITKDGKKFVLTLPAMDAGDTYTIVYCCSINDPDKIKGDFSVINTAKASSGGVETKPGTLTYSIGGLISKSVGKADYNTEKHTITWTVELNKNQADIAGYWLRDFMHSDKDAANELKTTVTYWKGTTDTNGKTTYGDTAYTGTLPFQFGADGEPDNAVYKFQYTTSDSPTAGKNNVVWNRAYLTKQEDAVGDDLKDDPFSTNSAIKADLSDRYQKTAEGVTANGGLLTLTWRLFLKPSHDLNGWTLTDTLQDGQYFTEPQKEELKAKLESALAGCGPIEIEFTPKTNPNTFTVTGTGIWKANYGVEIEFKSTRGKDDEDGIHYYTNKAVFDNYVFTARNAYHEGNVVQKVDLSTGKETEGEITNHERHTLLTDDEGYTLLKWGINVTATEKMKGAADGFTITETLPTDVELTALTLKSEDNCFFAPAEFTGYDGGSWTASVSGTTVYAIKIGNVVEVTIPQSLYNKAGLVNKIITLEVTVRPTGTWEHNTTRNFKNHVLVTSSQLIKSGYEAEQTQEIFNNENYNSVQKSGAQKTDALNQVLYTIVVNPEGKSYQVGENVLDRLELVDTLTCPDDVIMLLEDSQIAVYEYNAETEARGRKLGTDEYSYIYTEEDGENVLKFYLPNGKTLLVEYVYRGQGAVKDDGYTLKNNAVLMGTSSKNTETDSNISFKIQNSSASAALSGIALYKVDSANYGLRLQGAEFTLEKWAQDAEGSWDWQIVQEKITSDANGKLDIAKVDGKTPLVSGTAFRLIETKASEGYELDSTPFCFYIDSMPQNRPDSFVGEGYAVGQNVFVPNVHLGEFDLYKYTVTATGAERALAGAKFVLYQQGTETQYATLDVDGCLTGWTTDETAATVLTTPESGILHMEGLRAGTYYLKEIEAPAGYDVLKTPISVEMSLQNNGSLAPTSVDAEVHGSTVWIKNDATPIPSTPVTSTLGDFNVYKYTVDSSGEKKALGGAEFVLYQQKGKNLYAVLDADGNVTGWTGDETAATRLTTPDSGILHIRNLNAGAYYLQETTAPVGYDALKTPVGIVLKRLADGTFTLSSSDATVQGNTVSIQNNATRIPSTPLDPATPVKPSEPDQPTEPDNPSEPDKPTDPDNPSTPDTPSEPDAPSTPSTPDEPVISVLPVTPIEPSEVPEEPADSDSASSSEVPAGSDSAEPPASSEATEQPAGSDSGELPASPEEDASSLKPGAPGPDNQEGWVLDEHGADSNSAKPGAPTPDNTKGWVLGANGLIQTGQLNWPIPVLIALGGALVLAGVYLIRKSKRHQDE